MTVFGNSFNFLEMFQKVNSKNYELLHYIIDYGTPSDQSMTAAVSKSQFENLRAIKSQSLIAPELKIAYAELSRHSNLQKDQ